MEYDAGATFTAADAPEQSFEDGHNAQRPSYGLADILFPATPPTPKGARLVLGSVGLRSSMTEQWDAEPESASADSDSADVNATTAVEILSSVRSESSSSQRPVYKRRDVDRATRNRSLLAAAGLG